MYTEHHDAVNTSDQRSLRILGELGRGGFGVVLHAELRGMEGFRKEVAVKVLHGLASEQLARCLRDEARLLGLIQHPGVARVDSLMKIGGRWAVVMEYVDGVDIGRAIERGPLPLRVALEITSEIARVLVAAWETIGPEGQPLQLVHRDLKPFNIRVTPSGAIKVLDFGTARAQFSTREIHTTMVAGTPLYMAPERFSHVDVPAGDVYALGAVLYEMLCGQPFGCSAIAPSAHRQNVAAAIQRLQEGQPSLPPELVALITRMLDGEHTARPTASEVEDLCDRLAERVGGEGLKRWSARRVPELKQPTVPFDVRELGAGAGADDLPLRIGDTPRRSVNTPLPTAYPEDSAFQPEPMVVSEAPRRRGLWVALGFAAGVSAFLGNALVSHVPGGPMGAASQPTEALEMGTALDGMGVSPLCGDPSEDGPELGSAADLNCREEQMVGSREGAADGSLPGLHDANPAGAHPVRPGVRAVASGEDDILLAR